MPSLDNYSKVKMKREHFLKVILFKVVFIEGKKLLNSFILLEKIVSPEPQMRLETKDRI